MEFIIGELQCVKLIKEFKGLSIGTKGTIVLKYTENDFEVELFDSNGDTIGVVILSFTKRSVKDELQDDISSRLQFVSWS